MDEVLGRKADNLSCSSTALTCLGNMLQRKVIEKGNSQRLVICAIVCLHKTLPLVIDPILIKSEVRLFYLFLSRLIDD